jgi:CHAD domain-containing protein
MTTYQLEPKDYYDTLDHIVQKAENRLKKYLQDPNQENVHDVRTAIRRLEAAWNVLPKKIRRKPKVERFVRTYRKFFKINNTIRDFDIIQQRLASHAEVPKEIKKMIDEKRNHHLYMAQKQAKKAHKFKFPKITAKDFLSAKLERRFRKKSIQLINNIQSLIPIVISDEKKIVELHQLRKDCKKLRYILEITPNSESATFVTKLKEMQDLLGAIHDCDITINFLQKIATKIDNAEKFLKKESKARALLYANFVANYKSSEQEEKSSTPKL